METRLKDRSLVEDPSECIILGGIGCHIKETTIVIF